MLSTLPDTPATLSSWSVPHLGFAAWKTGLAAPKSPLISSTSSRRCELCLDSPGGGPPWRSSGRSQASVNPGPGKDAFRGSQATAGPPKPTRSCEGPSERQAEALRPTAHSRPQDVAPASDNPKFKFLAVGP